MAVRSGPGGRQVNRRHTAVPVTGPWECGHCGIRLEELPRRDVWECHKDGLIPFGDCTGNAYVCRVARKLIALCPDAQPIDPADAEIEWRNMAIPFARVPPWAMTAPVFFVLVDSIIGIPSNDTIRYLTSRLMADPNVCPILADALEEAGCTDSALLDALRTA